MNELRVDIGGSNRGFQIATEETKRMAQDLQRSLTGYTPDSFKGAQAMRDQYGKVFDDLKGGGGAGGLIRSIVGGFGQAGNAVMRLATGPIGFLTAMLAGVYEAAKKSWELMHESFELARDARTFGMTTTGLQRVNLAAEEQGFDQGEAQNRLYRFTNSVGMAAEGDKMQQGLFKDMGVEIQGRTMEQILSQVADAFDKIKDPAERARKAVELFGRGGQDMIPVLEQLKKGGGLLSGIVSDEQTDAILAGSWKKVHGFFVGIMALAKTSTKSILADFIEGYTGYKGDGTNPPTAINVQKETPQERATRKEREAKEAEKHTKELAEAQKDYRREYEATSNPQTRLALEMADRDELTRALAKAQAAHDEVEMLKIKTALLAKNKEIENTKKELTTESKKAAGKEPEWKIHEHVDSLSGAGLFTSFAATLNPTIEITRQQLVVLQDIRNGINEIKTRPDIYAP